MTGTEMAIEYLKQSWINRPLDISESKLCVKLLEESQLTNIIHEKAQYESDNNKDLPNKDENFSRVHVALTEGTLRAKTNINHHIRRSDSLNNKFYGKSVKVGEYFIEENFVTEIEEKLESFVEKRVKDEIKPFPFNSENKNAIMIDIYKDLEKSWLENES
ncbi:hypothetical protein ROZALSC1DRAFT_25908 [Rozella allomycis CSF55]|uniref:Uncharacterized protein n=1 Tax=Rozella allomycis (strain CSF55) TaxID=988480 RepID=A0A4P9YCK7_ROZAC|nr:hypothetical protein ROZALSC1DRAFT_25908 [Rozella allomycis CSF55]